MPTGFWLARILISMMNPVRVLGRVRGKLYSSSENRKLLGKGSGRTSQMWPLEGREVLMGRKSLRPSWRCGPPKIGITLNDD